MEEIHRMFMQNREWVRAMLDRDPDHFRRMTGKQTPHSLFIGCSDSRVPANEITGTRGGEIFVHRNVANQAISTDLNMLAVLQYAVEVLKVRHVIVCGHYGCGGVHAAQSLANGEHVLVDQWLGHIRQVRQAHLAELEAIADPDARERRLVELNVIAQVRNLEATSVIQAARARGQVVRLLGWVYNIGDGLLHTLLDDIEEPGDLSGVSASAAGSARAVPR
jgi:carbonic anhydrase